MLLLDKLLVMSRLLVSTLKTSQWLSLIEEDYSMQVLVIMTLQVHLSRGMLSMISRISVTNFFIASKVARKSVRKSAKKASTSKKITKKVAPKKVAKKVTKKVARKTKKVVRKTAKKVTKKSKK